MAGWGGPSRGADSAGACRCSGLHRVQTEGEVIEQGRQHLQSYLSELLDAIVKSVPACPPVIRAAFRQLFRRVGERFPQHQVRLQRWMDRGSNGDVPRGQGALGAVPSFGGWGPLLGGAQGWDAGEQRGHAAPEQQPWCWKPAPMSLVH